MADSDDDGRDNAFDRAAEAAGAAIEEELQRDLDALVERAKGDAGAPFEPAVLDMLATVRKRDPAAWERVWERLKATKVRLRELDKAVRKAGFKVYEGGGRGGAGHIAEAGPYVVTAAGLIAHRREVKEVTVTVPLANFRAAITGQEEFDDGAERRLLFGIEGTLADGRALPRLEVPARDFAHLNWVAEGWGADPLIFAGQGVRDHLRCAVQMLSGTVPRRTVYGHTGWRRVDGGWRFLHGDGGTGPNGTDRAVEVRLADRLVPYRLPDAPTGAALVDAVRASLALLDAASLEITAPLLCAVYRAPLGEVAAADFTLHLAGPSGAYKSALAGVMQAHFGAGFHAKTLPASWADTANALERRAFTAKDVLFTVDDYAPGGPGMDQRRLNRDADRLIRGAGNQSGRARMNADSSLRPTYHPRGLILSTGEDTPGGQSLRARLLVLEVAPGAIKADELTEGQKAATAGTYAAAMAGYAAHLARRLDDIRRTLPARQFELRAELTRNGMHRRTPDIAASLLVGWEHFLDFAKSAGAVNAEEAKELAERVRAGLEGAAVAQAAQQASEEIVNRFLGLLRAALASGRAHVAARDTGHEPTGPEGWGWREHKVGTGGYQRDEWRPLGERIGWVDGDDLLLEPGAVFAAVQKLAREQGGELQVSQTVLWRRLWQRRLLKERDESRRAFAVRKQVGGSEKKVLLLGVCLLSADTDDADDADGTQGKLRDTEAPSPSASTNGAGAPSANADDGAGGATHADGRNGPETQQNRGSCQHRQHRQHSGARDTPADAAHSRCDRCGDVELDPRDPLTCYGDPAKGGTVMHTSCRREWLAERRQGAPA